MVWSRFFFSKIFVLKFYFRAASSNASWNWNTNINPENEKLRAEGRVSFWCFRNVLWLVKTIVQSELKQNPLQASAASAAFTQKIGRCAIEKFQDVANACSASTSDPNCTLEDEPGVQADGYVPQLWTKEKQLRQRVYTFSSLFCREL